MEGEAPTMAPAVDQFVVVITTAAFDASLAFYRDVIGLEVVEEWTDAGPCTSVSTRCPSVGSPARNSLHGKHGDLLNHSS